MSAQPTGLNYALERLQKLEDASAMLLEILEGRVDREKVVKLRRLAKEFVEEFKLSGPVAWLVRVLPEEPILPGAPLISVAERLGLLDKEGIANVLSYLRNLSGEIILQIQRSISEVDPPAIASSIKAFPILGGRMLEILSGVYLEKVRGWPELLPTDLLLRMRRRRVDEKGSLKAGAPDLYREKGFVEPIIWAANVSKSFKSYRDYEASAEYVAELVSEYSSYMMGHKVGLNYAIVVYEEAVQERHKRVHEVFLQKVLEKVKDRINMKKFSAELFDLSRIKEDLEKNRRENEHANHLYATLREMKLIEK
ncbi:MAG: hypothetical protein B9J98_05695 [Candidatus Terraquivivens tikiterensis]|uniref:Uncharacterized protein n=1 Tax=Candidatus Terraquivivens tikiterensis TaxID=1980982 RepID=A0A2R7Y2B2_9ARCH|nr:MAG: hypothetical protein B9J98_05695 [Candidatus Terraquivivens tikiterensis]